MSRQTITAHSNRSRMPLLPLLISNDLMRSCASLHVSLLSVVFHTDKTEFLYLHLWMFFWNPPVSRVRYPVCKHKCFLYLSTKSPKILTNSFQKAITKNGYSLRSFSNFDRFSEIAFWNELVPVPKYSCTFGAEVQKTHTWYCVLLVVRFSKW